MIYTQVYEAFCTRTTATVGGFFSFFIVGNVKIYGAFCTKLINIKTL